MRSLLIWFLGVTALGLLPLAAQDTIVQEYSGSGSTTTGLFKTPDRWEVRWNARQVVSVAVMAPDGTIVAGAAGVLRGSLFVPLGGQYYLKVSDGTVPPPATPSPAATTGTNSSSPATTNTPSVTGTNTASGTTTNAPLAASTNAPPSPDTNAPTATPPPLVPDIDTPAPPPQPAASWHLQIIALSKTVAADQELSVYTPFFMVPDSAITPVPTPPVQPPPVLSNEQARTVVTIKGDNAQGSGFFMRSADGTFVVTHLHLLAGNPNVKLYTSSGAPITVLSLKGATDRDLALLAIKDDNYTYLPLCTDAATSVETGDQVIIPDIGQDSDVVIGTPGRIIGMAPDQIDFDNPMDSGCSGAPVIDVKSGKVLAIATAAGHVDVSESVAKAWAANPPPGSSRIIPYFGLPLYGVAGWETYDWSRFLAETNFLKQFHETTRCLDSYLNGRHRYGESTDDGPPDNRYFLNNSDLHDANETYKQQARGADRHEQLDAANELLFSLNGVADADMNKIQGGNYLYSYDQTWAQKELAYRKALKKELDDLSDNVGKVADIARTR